MHSKLVNTYFHFFIRSNWVFSPGNLLSSKQRSLRLDHPNNKKWLSRQNCYNFETSVWQSWLNYVHKWPTTTGWQTLKRLLVSMCCTASPIVCRPTLRKWCQRLVWRPIGSKCGATIFYRFLIFFSNLFVFIHSILFYSFNIHTLQKLSVLQDNIWYFSLAYGLYAFLCFFRYIANKNIILISLRFIFFLPFGLVLISMWSWNPEISGFCVWNYGLSYWFYDTV